MPHTGPLPSSSLPFFSPSSPAWFKGLFPQKAESTEAHDLVCFAHGRSAASGTIWQVAHTHSPLNPAPAAPPCGEPPPQPSQGHISLGNSLCPGHLDHHSHNPDTGHPVIGPTPSSRKGKSGIFPHVPLGERTLLSPRASCSQLGRQDKRVTFLSAKAHSQSKEPRQPGHADRLPRHCRSLDIGSVHGWTCRPAALLSSSSLATPAAPSLLTQLDQYECYLSHTNDCFQ